MITSLVSCSAHQVVALCNWAGLNRGGYFVKKKDKAGNWLPNGGWMDWKERKALQEGSKPVAAGADDFPTNF